jgi:hypothetical protein
MINSVQYLNTDSKIYLHQYLGPVPKVSSIHAGYPQLDDSQYTKYVVLVNRICA